MKRLLTAVACAALLPSALSAQEAVPQPLPPLDLEQTTLLRCSAVFAIVASGQARGEKAALAYPPLQESGKEYFVRTGARLMDELQVPRETVQRLMQREVGRLQAESAKAPDPAAAIDAVMEPCMLSLEASGL